MTRRTLVLALFAAGGAAPLRAQVPDLAPYLMPRAEEITLARSAAPAGLSDSATVLVMTRTGFTEAARGSNGFTCLVLRSFSSKPDSPEIWNSRIRAPHCFNAPASRAVLPLILRRAEWILAGVSFAEAGARTARGYAEHTFVMPEPGAIAYMLSHAQYLTDRSPHWEPHLMLYFDKTVPAASLGAGGFDLPVIDAGADPDAPLRTLLILLRAWSDGTPATGDGR